jgi:hypothetical protein
LMECMPRQANGARGKSYRMRYHNR